MKLIEKVKTNIIGKKNGYVKVYCPRCKKLFGMLKPEANVGKFYCPCGCVWETWVYNTECTVTTNK